MQEAVEVIKQFIRTKLRSISSLLPGEEWWPLKAAVDISDRPQINDGRARLTSLAVCAAGEASTHAFVQGQTAHIHYEYEVLEEIDGVLISELEICNASGTVIHGRKTFHQSGRWSGIVYPGDRVRFHQEIHLDVGVGEYFVSLGLASTDPRLCHRLKAVSFSRDDGENATQHCRAMQIDSFVVRAKPVYDSLSYGPALLEGDCKISLAEADSTSVSSVARQPRNGGKLPTVFHITHPKAGSQWIYKILRECEPDRVVTPQIEGIHFLQWPVREGRIYPTIYLPKSCVDKVRLPGDVRHFVVIRDLRDTLISGYFSIKKSHALISPTMAEQRFLLTKASVEDGLIHLMEQWLIYCANIQASWLESGHTLLRYEDLLDRDVELLEHHLLDRCGLQVPRDRFREVVLACRFEKLTKGRERGREDADAHERKGVAGDWRRFFTDRVKQVFKNRYGSLLMATGYEHNLDW